VKVRIKKLAVEMEIKNKGIEIEVRNTNGDHLGDLIISKSGFTWCRGRTRRANGVRINWEQFVSLLEAQ